MRNGKHGPMSDSRPNIVLIMADDMGFSDLGCFGSEIRTPQLDQLALGGLRLTQMYNNARCCPTRASLLTGLYAHQAGIGHMVSDLGLPAYQGFLNDRCVTLAEVLQLAGYQTFMAGKWHVGGTYSADPATWTPGKPGFPRPVDRGFDHHFGTLAGDGSYFNPHTLMRDYQPTEPEGEEFYYTDAISDEAVSMVKRGHSTGRPFFLYVAHVAPHWPLQALPNDIERYRGHYLNGWDEVRIRRHERLRSMGLIASDWAISPRDEYAPPWPEVVHKDWEDARMAVYAAQVDRIDQGIGRLVDSIRDLGIEDNTLVMFLSDNGGCAELLEEDGLRGHALPTTRDGRRVHVGNLPHVIPGSADTFMSYGLPWANASNSPFRLFKHWVHEGGISTPFIASWPSVVEPGSVEHAPAHVVDLMATFLDLAGIEYPETYHGRQVVPHEGESLVPLLHGQPWNRRSPIFWEHEGNRAVRAGRWKLVSMYGRDWELYDMNRDRTELCNLAGKMPSRVGELALLYDQWSERCHVVPWQRIRELLPDWVVEASER